MKAYVGIADSDGLLSFVPEGDVPDELMVLYARAAPARGRSYFWAAVEEEAAVQVGEDLASGRRRDATHLLWGLAREIVRYPTGIAAKEEATCSARSSALAVHRVGFRGRAEAAQRP